MMFEVVVKQLGIEGRADTRLHLFLQLVNVLSSRHGKVPLQCLREMKESMYTVQIHMYICRELLVPPYATGFAINNS